MGRPKGLLQMPDGRTVLEHVVSAARQLTSRVVILGSGFPLPASLARIAVLPDALECRGPLGGLCALLEHAGPHWALLVACDMPFIEGSLLARLCAHCRPDTDAVVFERAVDSGYYHPCCAAYHPRILDVVEQQLHNGRGSMHALLSSISKTVLCPTARQVRMLTNINTPRQWAALHLSASACSASHA